MLETNVTKRETINTGAFRDSTFYNNCYNNLLQHGSGIKAQNARGISNSLWEIAGLRAFQLRL